MIGSSRHRSACRLVTLLVWSLAEISLAQYNPLQDFCRRWGHQSAVVDRRLYIDGGLVNWKPFTSSSQNISNTFLTYNDLDTANSDGMPPLYATLSKNATIPNVSGGIFWEDSVNKRLYLYGGESYLTSPTSFVLYSYDILYDQWVSFGPPTGAGTIGAVAYGAGVSIPSRGEAYYYGGWFSNASVPGWSGPPVATSRMLKYTMDKNSWSNITGPDDIRRAEGAMVFIPAGDAGFLIYFGGSQDLYGNGTLTPQPLNKIFIYDVANAKWYTQKTTGRTPEIRRRFCAGATWAQDQSSYNIYLYGGAGFPPDTTGYDDIYILSIPSFQWIRGPYPPGSNVTGAYPKSMMSCSVVDNAQMLVIGGVYSNDTTYMCDADAVWGTHNMNFGKQNPDNAIWASYQPSLTTYTVPTDILTAVGGQGTGGATVTTPVAGFDAADLSVLMTRKAAKATRTPTRKVDLATPTNSPIPSPPLLSTGAIAGIAAGGGVLLIILAACCCIFVRKRRTRRKAQKPIVPPMQDYPNHQGAWAPSTQVSSPTLTTTSHAHHPPLTAVSGPPAELSSDMGRPGYMSPASGKYDGGFQQTAELASHSPAPDGGSVYYSPSPSHEGFIPSPVPGQGAGYFQRSETGWESYHTQGYHR